MATRIYKVTTATGTRLVDAAVRANALAFVARDEITCEVASGHDIALLITSGVKVESTTGPGQFDLLEAAEA